MTEFPKPRIVISKCIGFDACRYNGEVVHDKFVSRLEPHVEFICVCPEVEIGLGTPRDSVRIISSANNLKLIQPATGLDLTQKMQKLTAEFLNSVGEVDGFIMKTRSPSCGVGDVKYYARPERGASLGKTAGLFGSAVLDKFGDRAIEDECRLRNLSIREHFLTCILFLPALRGMQESGLMNGLARFHASNKFLLMAYNQTKLRELGRVVANEDRKTKDAAIGMYAQLFRRALLNPPKRASPINVLMHALGYFKKELSAREKKHFLSMLEEYRDGRAPLRSALSILASWIIRFESGYLNDQTLFRPFPTILITLDDSGKSLL